MDKAPLSPQSIWRELEKALQYNDQIGLNERVSTNENFFLGRQWEGVNAPDLDKPVFNILKRVVNYFIAMLVTDNVGVSLRLFNRRSDAAARALLGALEEQLRQAMEHSDFGGLSRDVLRDAAVDGDGVLHVFLDTESPTGRGESEGLIGAEVLDNRDVYFLNPCVHVAQRQPALLIRSRRSVRSVQREMLEAGLPKEQAENVRPDMPDCPLEDDGLYGDKVSVLTRYWKQDGQVWQCRTTRESWVTRPVCTGLTRYPLCFMNWEKVKHSYHGIGVIDGLIPNQMAINKMAALAQRFIRQQAFPRIFYNQNKLDKWVEGVAPLAVQGDPSDIIYSDNHSQMMSSQVGEYLDRFIANTRDLMGASDSALGSVRPENTSAIIAVQKATAMPLELVRQAYYHFVEEYVRIALDMMRAYYGRRRVLLRSEAGEEEEMELDFGVLNDLVLSLNVDIGASAYWSEMASIQTLDNLYGKGLVEAQTYLESIPAHLLPNKARIEADARRRREEEKEEPDEVPEVQRLRDAAVEE